MFKENTCERGEDHNGGTFVYHSRIAPADRLGWVNSLLTVSPFSQVIVELATKMNVSCHFDYDSIASLGDVHVC